MRTPLKQFKEAAFDAVFNPGVLKKPARELKTA
jgi:hypothetical protein